MPISPISPLEQVTNIAAADNNENEPKILTELKPVPTSISSQNGDMVSL